MKRGDVIVNITSFRMIPAANAYIEQTGTAAHDEPCLVEMRHAGCVVVWLTVVQVGAGIREVHHRR